MSKLYQAGQIDITKAEIEPPGGDSVDINTGVLKGFEICEDIFSNHLTATIALQDGYGIVSQHKVLGCGDKLTLSFKTPGKKEISVELYSYYMTPRYQVDTRIDAYEINIFS